jgi:hypothetical protein
LDVLSAIKVISEIEKSSRKREIISPIYNQEYVQSRIDGLICRFSIPKGTPPGWHVFVPDSLKTVKIVREAEYSEIQGYLEILQRVKMVTMYKKGLTYFCIPLKNSQLGLDFKEIVPVRLPSDDVFDFDTINVRYDGSTFWYQEKNILSDIFKASYLRESFRSLLPASQLKYHGLSLEEKSAYAIKMNLDKDILEKLKKDKMEKAVTHGGGKLIGFHEYNTHLKVTFSVDGQEYTSTVRKDDSLEVISSGICLSGEDSKFDLKSLVSVFREKQRKDESGDDDDY